MKKLFAFITILATGITISFSQTASSSNEVAPANQTVNAADAQKVDVKSCSPEEVKKCTTTSKSCCAHKENSASATTSSTGAELAKEADKCQSVSFGTTAAKPNKD